MSTEVQEYRPATKPFAELARKLPVGGFIEIGKDFGERQSRYVNAKKACPRSKFSVQKQGDGSFRLYKVS
jgi:hypothetical protein